MDKQSYLLELREALSMLSEQEVNDIISDYDSHFEFALDEGKTEEEIISGLGDVAEVASKYIPNSVENENEKLNKETESEVEVVEVEEVIKEEKTQQESTKSTYNEQQSSQVVYTQVPVKKGRSAAGELLMALLLIFLNVTFILGPFLAIWGVWLGFIISGVAIVAEGIKMIVLASTIADYSAGLSELTLLAQIGFYLSFGGCISLLMIKAAKGMGNLTKRYLNWNVRLVKGV